MTLKRQRILIRLGITCLVVAVAFAAAVSKSLGGGTLDIYPGIAYVGIVLLAISGVARIENRSVAVFFAWVLRIANAIFLLVTGFMLFLLLPLNQNSSTSWPNLVVVNGLLVLILGVIWWVAHREICRALRKENGCPTTAFTAYAKPGAAERAMTSSGARHRAG